MLKCWERNSSDYQLVAYQGHGSNVCSKELMKTHKIVVAVMGTIVGSTALAILCFDKKAAIGGALNPRVYDYISVGLSGSFLPSAVMLPKRKLQDTKKPVCVAMSF